MQTCSCNPVRCGLTLDKHKYIRNNALYFLRGYSNHSDNFSHSGILHELYLPRTVRKALEVLTGIVNKEQVYCPSSDSDTSVTLMVSSCHEARRSSILLSLKAVKQKYKHTVKTFLHQIQYVI